LNELKFSQKSVWTSHEVTTHLHFLISWYQWSKTYHFHDEWEIKYFFVMAKDKCCYLICNASISLQKKKNRVIWNFIIMLSIAISMMLLFHPKMKFVNLRSKHLNRQQLMAKLSNNATILSFKVSNLIVKKRQTFHWREICKSVFSWNSL
jgi:hypothetical protein